MVGVNSFKAPGEALNFAVSVAEVQRFLVEAEKGAFDLVPVAARKEVCTPKVVAEGRSKMSDAAIRSYDYYCNGKTTAEPDGAGKLMMAMNIDEASKDMSGAIDELQKRSGRTKVGAIGFCMGGGLALVVACKRPDAVAATAPFYGLIPWESAQPDWSAMAAKVEGHYAADDHSFPPDKAEELQTKLRSLGKDATLFVYPEVDHAFFNDTRPEVYDEATAAIAWARVLDLFRTELTA